MSRARVERVACEVVELDGVRYAIVPESVLQRLCQRAGAEFVRPAPRAAIRPGELADAELDGAALARRLLTRRKRAGLSQAHLARRAGIRVETLNRIERGKTTPDFATIRKLVVAMNAAEAELSAL
jgi:DNA-binding XRE family transcriptional regulator